MRPAASAAASPRRSTSRDRGLAARPAALMRAAFCRAPGTLIVEDVPCPTPGAGEVVVRVRHCGICGSDLHWYHGQTVMPVGCPGHEISGEVANVGAGVTSLKAGDAVALEGIASCGSCRYCLAGDYQRCPAVGVVGMTIPGGFADYVKMPARHCFRVPVGVDFATAALAEPLGVAVHAVRLARLPGAFRPRQGAPGDRLLRLWSRRRARGLRRGARPAPPARSGARAPAGHAPLPARVDRRSLPDGGRQDDGFDQGDDRGVAPMIPLERLTHVGLCVSDLERSLRFYRDLLGFRPVKEIEVEGEPADTLLGLRDVKLRAAYLERDGVTLE